MRIPSIDHTRGFAILLMVFSGIIPHGVLPIWMYHAQVPPPHHQFNPDLPGFSWVDLVFPMFIFCMGVSIPLALKRRIHDSKLLWITIFKRTFLLVAFAIVLQHFRPEQMSADPDTWTWIKSLIGFCFMFLLFAKYPKGWWPKYHSLFRILSWVLVAWFLGTQKYNGASFSLHRSDIIILILSNIYFFTSVVWVLTRKSWIAKIVILGCILAIHMSHPYNEWLDVLYSKSPFPWLFRFEFIKYLFISVVALMVTDLLEKTNRSTFRILKTNKYLSDVLIIFLLITSFWSLHMRFYEWGFSISLLILGIYYYSLVALQEALRPFFLMGFSLFLLGMLFEPFEGGIKKDPPTMSYFFISGSLTLFILVQFFIHQPTKNMFLEYLSANGKNPMIAYVGFGNLLLPILEITGIGPWIEQWTQAPWLGCLRGLIYTIIVGLIVVYFTKRKIFWKT